MITLEQVKADPSIKTYIRMADASLGELGFTEHSVLQGMVLTCSK